MQTDYPPTPKSFFEKLESRVQEVNSLLCVGLDPHFNELFPELVAGESKPNSAGHIFDAITEETRCDAAFTFCKTLIDATVPYAAAYKPNSAFFEALGPNLGTRTLRRVIDAIPSSIPVLLDVKRGDIGTTAQAYAEACFEKGASRGLGVDGVTLSPLMGYDSIRPFVTGKYSDKGAFILCKTSNPGSNDLLALSMLAPSNHDPSLPRKNENVICSHTLFEKIASLAKDWSDKAATENSSSDGDTRGIPHESMTPHLGLVVGATDIQALKKVRKVAGPKVWILAPGIGAQGGDLDAACRAGLNSNGSCMLIPISRGISQAADPGVAARNFQESINAVRREIMNSSTVDVSATTQISLGDSSVVASISPYQQEFIEFCLQQGVLKFGSFLLKSGRSSPYFFNAGLFSSGCSLFKLGSAYAAAVVSSPSFYNAIETTKLFDVIFGPAYKGIPLGAVVSAVLFDKYGLDVGFAYNRKEVKDHGEGGLLVGSAISGKRILIIDDVITAGTAIRDSYDLIIDMGAIPVGVVIALDRAEKLSLEDPISAVQGVARDLKIPVVSIISLPQIQVFLESHSEYKHDILKQVRDYRNIYGI